MAHIMAKDHYVGFKTGLQATLDQKLLLNDQFESDGVTSRANAVPGCFYLTSDTHRLYVGNNDKSLSPVNEGIITVESASQLPTVTAQNKSAYAGQFYYISGTATNPQNILCVYSGQGWVQINQVVDTYVGNVANAATVSGSTATIQTTVDNYAQGPNGFTDGSAIGGQSKKDSFTIGVEDGLTVTADGNKGIKIGDGRSLTAAAGTTTGTVDITYGDGTNDSSVTLGATADSYGNVNTAVTYDTTKQQILISAKDTHVTDKSTFAASAAGGYTLTLKDQNGASLVGANGLNINPEIKIGTTAATQVTKTFINNVADFTDSIYSKADIDNLMQDLNAMHYIGTVGSDGTAGRDVQITSGQVTGIYTDASKTTLRQVSAGDTFLLTKAITVNGIDYGVGSLLIAQGTEDPTTGYITSPTFAVVKESTNTDTTYYLNNSSVTNGYKVGLVEIAGGSMAGTKGSLAVVGSDKITVTGTNPNGQTAEKDTTITITHKDSTYTSTSTPTPGTAIENQNGSLEATVLNGVTVDDQGHITGITSQKITITEGEMSSNTYATSAANNVGTITNTVAYKYNGGKTTSTSGSVTVESSSLQVAANAQNNGLAIDMVWGSF